MIAPQILILSAFLSFVWGWHLLDAIRDYRVTRARMRDRTGAERRRGDVPEAMRRLVAALCLFSICVAYVLRTSIVLLGFGDAIAGQVTFFAIIGVNVPGGLFVLVSRRFD